MLCNDEMLCVDCMQSFCYHADFDNFNVHVISNLQIKCKTMRKIAYENHSIQYLVIIMIRTEIKYSCVWSVKDD